MKTDGFNKFAGTSDYVTSEPLRNAVNASIALGRPLLIRGEPGTGKTRLAHSIAQDLGKTLIVWNIKSTTKAQDGLYGYDTVQRLNDSRFGDRDITDIKQYIKLGRLGQSFASPERVVLLIDEVDKADIEFPNDLLNELDEMAFHITETNEMVSAIHRPITVITSNAEKELPDAFLRRCIFHYIEFPDAELMEEIVRVHYPDIRSTLLGEALKTFYSLRRVEEFRKKPSTSELIDWIQVLVAGGVVDDKISSEVPFLGALLKKEADYDYFVNRRMTRMGDTLVRRQW